MTRKNARKLHKSKYLKTFSILCLQYKLYFNRTKKQKQKKNHAYFRLRTI